MSRVRVAAVLVAVALAWVAVVPGPGQATLAGDAKVADTLFKSGRAAYQKGDFAGAATLFRKALEEAPDLIEACWWCASSQEKAGDKASALASYREFVSLFDAKVTSGVAPSKEEQRLKGLADKSVDALSTADREIRKIEDAYVASMLSFAKDNFVRDPGMSAKAAEAILAVRPDHEEAKKLREKLLGESGVKPAFDPKNPFAGVSKWVDAIAEPAFKSNFITYPSGLMVVDVQGGRAFPPTASIDRTNPYCVEFELRCADPYNRSGWTVGLGVSWRDNNFESVMVRPGRVILQHNLADGSCTDLMQHDIPQFDAAGWHRVGIVVRGQSMEVWYGGKSVMSWKAEAALGGGVCICIQGCRAEWRLFRLGNLE
jgi:hypothetical protein